LNPALLRSQGVLAADPIRRMCTDFVRGGKLYRNQLWDVLMFPSWLERDGADLGAQMDVSVLRVAS
jgi:hypothetical protein